MKCKFHNAIDLPEKADVFLRGKRVSLLTNASGVNKSGIPTYRILHNRYNLCAMFAPEHGIRTNLQDGGWSDDIYDKETGLPVYTLSSKGNSRIDEILEKTDVVCYDIQDVGARFYTYLYNLTYLMRNVAKYPDKEIVIFDRINPINSVIAEGIMLDESVASSHIGEYSVPVRYGLTVGEFAKYINAEKNIGCNLDIIPCGDYPRGIYADETDLLFVNPSPNINSVDCAINYIGTCIFEATNISEGRGTTNPFSLVGAPFVDSSALCSYMNGAKIDGAVFREAYFTPGFGKHAGEVCGGTQIHITDRNIYSPLRMMLYMYAFMRETKGFEAREGGLRLRYGDNTLRDGYDPETEYRRAKESGLRFLEAAKKYRIY